MTTGTWRAVYIYHTPAGEPVRRSATFQAVNFDAAWKIANDQRGMGERLESCTKRKGK